ncbi:hypothetical protein FRC03_007546 [Tulasnella sp. 419]|nr:hypothetical protein FRC03_007546 [Tulasnella sp. 419]
MATASVSRNPFINPPAARNPFLSRVTTSQSSTPSNSQAAAAPEVNVPLPPSPEPQVTELPSQASVDIPVETPASSTPPALPPRRYAPPPGPPPSVLIAAADTSPAATPAPRSYSPPPPSFRAESPPPYTASPDYRTGEQLLELGPARPFQNRRPVLPPQQPRYVAPNPTGRSGGSWSASVNGVNEHYTGSSRFGANGSSSSWAMFPGTLIQNITGVLNSPYLQPQSTGRSASRSHPELSTTLYEPPSGRPPRSNESGLRSSDPDDGTPTTVPTPGRPLLRNGKVLVYPQGYECPKCELD